MPNFAQASNGLMIPENVLEATGEYVSPEQAAQDSYEALAIREELRRVDPRLDVIFVKPGSEAFPISPRWYFVRRNEQTVDSYWVIQDENENYSPPTFKHVEWLRRFDTAARGRAVWDEFEKARKEREARAEKRRQELRREFREKLLERLDFIFDGPSVQITAEHKEKLNGEADEG